LKRAFRPQPLIETLWAGPFASRQSGLAIARVVSPLISFVVHPPYFAAVPPIGNRSLPFLGAFLRSARRSSFRRSANVLFFFCFLVVFVVRFLCVLGRRAGPGCLALCVWSLILSLLCDLVVMIVGWFCGWLIA